jgi:hypothetical protein
MNDDLDDDHPLWLVNEQIKGFLEGDGADEDHQDVLDFLMAMGLPESTVKRVHKALVCSEVQHVG